MVRKITKVRSSVSWDKEILKELEEFRKPRKLERSEVVNMAVADYIKKSKELLENDLKQALSPLIEVSVKKAIESPEFAQMIVKNIKENLGIKDQ